MTTRDASTQTFMYQKLPLSSFSKNKLCCENCEFSWLNHEKDYVLVYYYRGDKYCLDCRHTMDELDKVKYRPVEEKKDKWIAARSSVRRFRCCDCSDVSLNHHLGDKHYGQIPVYINAAIPKHKLCVPCYNSNKLNNTLSPESCINLPCIALSRDECGVQ